MEDLIKDYRAHWSLERLRDWIPADGRILDLGAGDCRLDRRLSDEELGPVVSVDVEDLRETEHPLTLYDGERLPFRDDQFDVVLLLFVLHHAEDPLAVLKEAQRVCRADGRIIAFEDQVRTFLNRFHFRLFHRFLLAHQGIPVPLHELDPDGWIELGRRAGLEPVRSETVGRQMSFFHTPTCRLVWSPAKAG